ncbi:hypothetical protein N9U05_00205, partial [bacterium]|nr:hypothetical protein [bacterium]
MNGSFFAMLYSIVNFGRLWSDSSHDFLQKIIISLQFAYFCFQVFLSWILPANFFLSVYFVLSMTFPGSWISSGVLYIYILVMVRVRQHQVFLLAVLHRRPSYARCTTPSIL